MKQNVKTSAVLWIAIILLIALIAAAVCGCTKNSRAKNYGGSMTITLPKGQRIVEATWKNSDLWYLTEQMDSDYTPKKKVFKEVSQWGVWEGEITFIESR